MLTCQTSDNFHHSHERWIADTGSAQDLLTRNDIPDEFQYRPDRPIAIITANGHSSSALQAKVYNDTLGCKFDPYLLESTPPVMSVGVRCVDQGYDFVWRSGKSPYFGKPEGYAGSSANESEPAPKMLPTCGYSVQRRRRDKLVRVARLQSTGIP